MKQFLSIMTSLVFLWIILYNTAVVTMYEVDKASFTNEHCENIDKPELECEGKCHLSKQLVDQSELPSQQDAPLFLPEILLFVSHNEVNLDLINSPSYTNFPTYVGTYSYKLFHLIDHPPQV